MEAEEKKYTLPELKNKLTEKEFIFCHEVIIKWNGAESARKAGYSENSARQIATENLSKPHIQQYIDFIKNDYEKECGITKIRQLNELAKIAYSSISHLHETWITLQEYETIKKDNPSALDAIESTETKKEVKYRTNPESDKKESYEVEYIKIKLFPKLSAIAEINKMMGYNEAEKVDLSSAGNKIKGITFDD